MQRYLLGLSLLCAQCTFEDEVVSVATAVTIAADFDEAQANDIDFVEVVIGFTEGSSPDLPLALTTTLGRFVDATGQEREQLALSTDGSSELRRTLVVGRTPGRGLLSLTVADKAVILEPFTLAPAPPTDLVAAADRLVLTSAATAANIVVTPKRPLEKGSPSIGSEVRALSCCTIPEQSDSACDPLLQLSPVLQLADSSKSITAVVRLTVEGENLVRSVEAETSAVVDARVFFYISDQTVSCDTIAGDSSIVQDAVTLQLGRLP